MSDELGSTSPSWLVPQSVEGIGSSLADAVYRLTRCPAAVVIRDPTTETASVIAASSGADRRLLGSLVAPTSAVGRACIGDVTVYGVGAVDLLGDKRRDRREQEEQGVAFSLLDGRRTVGAMVVFTSPARLDSQTNNRLEELATQAGQAIGRTLTAETAKHRGLIDEITGQHNREGLEHAMRDPIRERCSLVCMNIDQLTELDRGLVNPMLRHVASVLRNSLRDCDVPARIADAAFALFLPDTVLDNALRVAERVRMAVSQSTFERVGCGSLTCSAGVASIPDTVSDVNGLMAAAAKALEEAKAEGRNRVVAAHA